MARAQYKFTAQLGAGDRGEVTVAAGDAEAQSATISINIDVDPATTGRGQMVALLDQVRNKVLSEPWPPLA